MAHYVDGFLIPLPKRKLPAYIRMAKAASKIWLDHGALQYRECAGENLNVKMGLPFPRGIKSKAGETIVFSWIVYKSRKHRDAVNAKVMKDPRIHEMMKEKPPFDEKRMMYGGFEVVVSGDGRG